MPSSGYRLIESDVNDLSLTGFVALNNRQQNAQRRVDCRRGVSQGDIGPDRRVPRLAVDVAKTAVTLGDRGVARFGGEGTGLAVTGDARIDDARVDGLDPVRPQSPLFNGPGAKIFHHHISLTQQFKSQLLPAFGLQVQGDTFFIPGQGVIPQ